MVMQQHVSSPAQTEALVVLLAKVAQGDREAFTRLYEATSLKLFGTALRILRRRALAEDILQEIYVKIWERAGDYSPTRASPITWMVTIARNRALDELRREPNLVSSEDVPGFDDIASAGPSALEHMEHDERYVQLSRCLNGIEDEKRQMLLLAYDYGLSRELLAKKFHQPVSTIKTWLRRSLLSLKLCLET